MDAARGAYGPSEADRSRIRESLALRVAAVAATSASVSWWSSIASALGSKAGILGIVGCIGIGSAGSIGYWQLRHVPRAVPVLAERDSSKSFAASEPALPPPKALTPPAAEAPNLIAPAAAGRASKTKSPPPNLHGPDVEGEIALLSEAQKALSAGQPERALQFLDEHARTFPRGTLAEERTAARIVALCKLGRVAKAKSEAAAFLQRLPDSPLSERVRVACGDSVTQGSTVP
jgi:RNA polymerase sigma-70 factor (ECF subfamily)